VPSADFWVGPHGAPDTYRLTSLLGGGGEGEVWRAVLPLSAGGRSTVAVKILRATGDPDEDSRWERFGHLLRSLSHPGLVRITDVFTGPQMHRETGADPTSRSCFVVMDFIDGPTLREWCDEHPDATAAQRLRMLRMVASALDEMHSGAATQIPVAHGDVKPANVVVRDGDGTVLVDLGLTRLTDGAGVAGRSTPYAAPELRAPGAMATPEADRYAFAVTTAQVLTGQSPPTGPDGWLDPGALASLLRAHPVTSRRPLLVRQVLDAIAAPPEARPRQLRIWLDSASDTLSQVTTGQPTAAATAPLAASYAADPATEILPTQPAAYADPIVAVPPPRRRRRALLASGVAALLVVAAIATFLITRPATGTPDQVNSASGLSTLTTTPTPATTDTGTTLDAPSVVDTATPTADATGVPTGPQFLNELNPVDEDPLTLNGTTRAGSFSSSGTTYGHAIRMKPGCSNDDGGTYWVDYDIGRKWSTFTTTVGLSDDSPTDATASYTLIADTKPIATGKLALGTAAPINLPVTNVLRLRLQINNPESSNPKCRAKTSIIWGDPTLAP
jgi:serine/threonine protein kinase